MSNRQVIIIGLFAVVCSAVLGLAINSRTSPGWSANSQEVPSVGRYQLVSFNPGDKAYLVVLDTATGETWQARLKTDLEDVEKWHALGSPALTKKSLPPAVISAM
jgi:hypothetical protein